MTGKPEIEIIMATYNGARFLEAQVDSLLKQTYHEWRLLVRDDSSTDNTVALLKALSDRDDRIHLVSDGRGNLGMNGNFNHLLTLTTAPYVMYCDWDDVWLPEKIELTLNEMLLVEEESGGPALVHTDASVVDSNLAILRNRFIGRRGRRKGLSALIFANCVQGAATMINSPLRDMILRAQPMLPYDYHNGVVAAATGQRRFIDKPLLLYRQHSSNTIGAGWKIDLAKLQSPTGISPTLQMAINGFPILRQTLEFFADELSATALEELNDASQLLFGDNIRQRLRIALRRRYGFYRRRDNLNLLLYICHVNNI